MRRGSLLVFGLTAVAILSLSALTACGGGEDNAGAQGPGGDATPTLRGGEPPPPTSVRILDNLYAPASIRVKVGEEAKWEWAGKNPHTVSGTYEGQEIDSGEKTGPDTFSVTFDTPGTFEYQCNVHPQAMKGKVIIEAE